jgi:hypothetical protein
MNTKLDTGKIEIFPLDMNDQVWKKKTKKKKVFKKRYTPIDPDRSSHSNDKWGRYV